MVCFDHMQMKLSETPTLPFISRAIAAMIPVDKTDEWFFIFLNYYQIKTIK